MTFPVRPSRARCTATTKLFTSPDPFTLAPSPPPSSLNLFTIRSNSKAEVIVSLQSTHTNCVSMDSRKARVMVRFPLAGKPVRHIAGGLGNEEWPRTEERVENWASRQGYVVVRSSMVGAMSMVMMLVALIIASRKRRNHECCRSLQIFGDPHSRLRERAMPEGRKWYISSPFAVMFRVLISAEQSI